MLCKLFIYLDFCAEVLNDSLNVFVLRVVLDERLDSVGEHFVLFHGHVVGCNSIFDSFFPVEDFPKQSKVDTNAWSLVLKV